MRITRVYASKEARNGTVAFSADQGMEAGLKQLDPLLVQPAWGNAHQPDEARRFPNPTSSPFIARHEKQSYQCHCEAGFAPVRSQGGN